MDFSQSALHLSALMSFIDNRRAGEHFPIFCGGHISMKSPLDMVAACVETTANVRN
jgi:hypothetical protein